MGFAHNAGRKLSNPSDDGEALWKIQRISGGRGREDRFRAINSLIFVESKH
jgi:hypothetical protein